MSTSLIPAELLKRSDKILFIAHLALGDFTYLQSFFKAFAAQNPHLKIHLWVDEVRRTADATQWPHLKHYSLYDWVRACPFFDKVYDRTYSPALYGESIAEARREAYPIVVSLATLRPQLYASLARKISPSGLVIGMTRKIRLLQLHHLLSYRKLDAAMPAYKGQGDYHISDVYAHWFRQLSDLELTAQQRFPFVDIPENWRRDTERTLQSWGFWPRQGKLVMINPYAKTKKRCWPLDRVVELVRAMQAKEHWRDASFIVNAVPQELDDARAVIGRHGLERTVIFSAQDNFFQLPALLERCDLIISVETAVMHLANAVHVPVVALMRQKNPEWVPLDHANSTVITAPGRRDWVQAISVEQVMEAIR
ncbi:glycosyltransferase family 9 protein [Herbaspirillum sp. YR522]|uniref:glycosyltransferase family 9 protein n=1 Tax=Herbaspirillum sp. YR522 TaxID=1144342 RepID=UPI00026F654D|nr:glycosyltransferase family 9 protein [Herbaspirillum sp. YR522]EJN01781.1 ADP-heptose:LPS heptosyltransferase [Herbaspirillum sp. YR522]